MPRVLILGLDTFAAKNIAQLTSLGGAGFQFDVATTDWRRNSKEVFAGLETGGHRLIILGPRLGERWTQVSQLLECTRYHHVELYPGGRYALGYLTLLRCYGHRWCVVERGDIGNIGKHPWVTGMAIRAAYGLADAVWYKEPYMEPLLVGYGAKRLSFLPNAAAAAAPSTGPRDLDFLWVNRFVAQREPRWVANSLCSPPLLERRSAMLGLQPPSQCDALTLANQGYVENHRAPRLELQQFVPPAAWYPRARFFVLPARVVFGNNALLEAMAHGVVPLVTRSPGIDLLIRDGENGLISAHEELAFHATMQRAAAMPAEEWSRLSAGARATIAGEFSVSRWQERMLAFYRSFEG